MKKHFKHARFEKHHLLHNAINGTQGVISLFLALLMVPFTLLAGALIDAARIRSATAIFDEVLCNASNSSLGTYDEFLKSRFGLLAVAQRDGSSTYSSDDFINDVFSYYVEENLKVLNNAFTTYTSEALGVYPLSNREVLRTEVLEYSKYTVPTKLVIDGLSLDSIIKSLTSSANLVGGVLDTFSSVGDLAVSLDDCQEKMDSAIAELKSCEKDLSDSNTAYGTFQAAASDYNAILREMLAKRKEAEEKLADAQSTQDDMQAAFDQEAVANAEVLGQIEALENETDSLGNQVDNTAAIQQLQEDHKDELAAYNAALEQLETANQAVSDSQDSLASINAVYGALLDSQRAVTGSGRDAYATALDALATSILESRDAVIGAQEALDEVLSSGESLANDMLSTAFDLSSSVDDKAIDEMKENQQAATDRGDDTAAYLWGDQIDEYEDTVVRAGKNLETVSDKNSEKLTMTTRSERFVEYDFASKFDQLHQTVLNLKSQVESYTLATGDSHMPDTSPLQLNGKLPITKADLEKLQEDLAKDMLASSLFDLLTSIIGFIESIKNLSLQFNEKLNANVNLDALQTATIDNSPAEMEADQQQSELYKQLYGSYASSADGESSIALNNSIDNLLHYYRCIKETTDKFSILGSEIKTFAMFALIVVNFNGILTELKVVIQNISKIGDVVYSRLLLAGYIGYNTASRSTYKNKKSLEPGTALTGASFVTAKESSASTALFCGAETEYILAGEASEIENQKTIFATVFLLRLAYDLLFVFTNAEVSSIAASAGAATMGFGTVVVYVLYILFEPLVDTLILVNGGTVPIVKTTLYLTPSGVPKLINAFISLDLSDDTKNTLYKDTIKFMSAGTADDTFTENYANAISSGIKDPELSGTSDVVSALNFNYQKTLILLLILQPTDTMLKRLANVIQMEAAYHYGEENCGDTFRLNRGYTYVRASGSFSGGYLFGTDLWSSNGNHIVYRGY